MSNPLWTPTEAQVRGSNLTRFVEKLRQRHQLANTTLPTGDFMALHRWSVAHPEDFWAAAWEDMAAEHSGSVGQVLTDHAMPPKRGPGHEPWFPGVRFNFARHLLRFDDDRPALVAEGENTPRRTVTYRELRALVARCQAALRGLGVGPGDRVAAYLPNTVETIVAMLAATSLGAIWSSTSPDFGFQGVMDRFGQIDPKVLFCADGYHYGGKTHHTLERAAKLRAEIPSIAHMVVVPFLGGGAPAGENPPGTLPPNTVMWDAFLAPEAGNPALEFPEFPFDQPVYIMYSSGTTGAPKCIVHGAGGTLLKHHVEQALHADLKRDDVLFYFTTCGWMMWNWLVSGLAQGCTLVLYDGSPVHPTPTRLFELAQTTGTTHFGTSPKFLAGCEKGALQPMQSHPMPALRTIFSTGAPLEPRQFHWVYEAIKKDVQLASIAGGTDLIGCFMGGNPWSPVYAGEIQGPSLAMDIAALDGAGQPVTGQQGELVCRNPFPSMPVGFWQDEDGSRYHSAYFADYPGMWRHGDFITITEGGGVIVYGRSDATLNPGGVRIGTAEIYRIVEALPQVLDSLVVGVRRDGEEHVALFVVLAEGVTLDEALEKTLRGAIREKATPRHVPAFIRAIPEVPITINGKKVELAARSLLHGEDVQNRDALANPSALDVFSTMEL